MTAVTVRPARIDDADAVVPLMHASSRDLIDYSFGFGGRDPEALLRRDFVRRGGIFGADQQIVAALADGRVVATVTAYAARRVRRLTTSTMITAASTLGPIGFVRAVARSLAIARLFAPPRDDALFIANACVAEELRGQRIFSLLFAEALRLAEREGLAHVELDVSFTNPSAQAKYERLGFVVVEERAPGSRGALPGFRRMRRPVA